MVKIKPINLNIERFRRFIIGLIFAAIISCSKDTFVNKKLLLGTWKLQNNVSLQSPSTIEFNPDNTYKMNYPSTRPNGFEYIESGKYDFNGRSLKFVSSIHSILTDTTENIDEDGHPVFFDPRWSTDSSHTHNIIGPIIFIDFDLQPVIWEILQLSENLLKVKVQSGEILYYKMY